VSSLADVWEDSDEEMDDRHDQHNQESLWEWKRMMNTDSLVLSAAKRESMMRGYFGGVALLLCALPSFLCGVQSVPELCWRRQPSDYRNLAIKAKPLML
jgi:hypothetical protein